MQEDSSCDGFKEAVMQIQSSYDVTETDMIY